MTTMPQSAFNSLGQVALNAQKGLSTVLPAVRSLVVLVAFTCLACGEPPTPLNGTFFAQSEEATYDWVQFYVNFRCALFHEPEPPPQGSILVRLGPTGCTYRIAGQSITLTLADGRWYSGIIADDREVIELDLARDGERYVDETPNEPLDGLFVATDRNPYAESISFIDSGTQPHEYDIDRVGSCELHQPQRDDLGLPLDGRTRALACTYSTFGKGVKIHVEETRTLLTAALRADAKAIALTSEGYVLVKREAATKRP